MVLYLFLFFFQLVFSYLVKVVPGTKPWYSYLQNYFFFLWRTVFVCRSIIIGNIFFKSSFPFHRIVTSETDSDYLVVPVEVEVSGQPGLFCPHDGLHFGLRTPHDPPSSLPLHLLNSAHKHIHIQVRFSVYPVH